ncbi:MAG TPA: hypothetical protein VHJ18_26620, partial [Streptosporangiaceae bacterium]|nr:hypothetical protein [Streptosporangiaceae bacterium]
RRATDKAETAIVAGLIAAFLLGAPDRRLSDLGLDLDVDDLLLCCGGSRRRASLREAIAAQGDGLAASMCWSRRERPPPCSASRRRCSPLAAGSRPRAPQSR